MFILHLYFKNNRVSVCDNNDSGCDRWAADGECLKGNFLDWMARNCKKSCNLCRKSNATVFVIFTYTHIAPLRVKPLILSEVSLIYGDINIVSITSIHLYNCFI